MHYTWPAWLLGYAWPTWLVEYAWSTWIVGYAWSFKAWTVNALMAEVSKFWSLKFWSLMFCSLKFWSLKFWVLGGGRISYLAWAFNTCGIWNKCSTFFVIRESLQCLYLSHFKSDLHDVKSKVGLLIYYYYYYYLRRPTRRLAASDHLTEPALYNVGFKRINIIIIYVLDLKCSF